jgi:uncharacterized damage-inducible protein DinB
MSSASKTLEGVARHAITGKGAHVETDGIFSGLDWKVAGARRRGVPHSLYQLLNHMEYWQDWVVQWLDGKDPPVPAHASGSWPGGVAPADRRQWEAAVAKFRRGLAELDRRARSMDLLSGRGRKSRLEMLQTIGAHNSYHAGQAVLLRKLLGTWPPPGGGVTW